MLSRLVQRGAQAASSFLSFLTRIRSSFSSCSCTATIASRWLTSGTTMNFLLVWPIVNIERFGSDGTSCLGSPGRMGRGTCAASWSRTTISCKNDG